MSEDVPFFTALASGAVAGVSVDVALYPIDTIKTRMQSPQGFFKAGGFNGVYRGITAAAAGSAPGAALFFASYETGKTFFNKNISSPAGAQMAAATFAETMACLVRVPTEVVKQRMQTGVYTSMLVAVPDIIKKEGVMGLYSGFGITVMREIPFSAIQFPIYERMKLAWKNAQDAPLAPWQAAACGSIAGGFSAAVTTPLDVIKTRLMLGADAEGVKYKGTVDVVQRVIKDEGAKKMFSGIQPRVMWISIGGFVFFGAYENARKYMTVATEK